MNAPRRFKLKPMDGIFRAVTVVCAGLAPLTALSSRIDAAVIIVLLMLLVVGWFRPLALEVDAGTLRIVCPLRSQVFQRAKIAKAWRLDYGVLRPMLRLGVGGLFGNFGMFYRPGKGWVNVCVTSTRDLVLLELEGSSPLLLSPRDPANFLESLGLSEERGMFE
jgi:Bacterial PH domain